MPIRFIPFLFLLGAAWLSGCYTQLATRGHESVYPPNTGIPDSLAYDSTLAPPGYATTPDPMAPTVIVNNYYDPGAAYRGYSHWEWDYPAVSFGYYSSRYDRFSRPWWWDDPWYMRRHHHNHHRGHPHHGGGPVHVNPRPSVPSGPYQSDKRLYNPAPSYPPVRKGRRGSRPAAAPPGEAAPVVQTPRDGADPAPAAPAPAPKEGTRATDSGTSGGSAGAAPAGSDAGDVVKNPSAGGSGQDGEYRSLKKGRRR